MPSCIRIQQLKLMRIRIHNAAYLGLYLFIFCRRLPLLIDTVAESDWSMQCSGLMQVALKSPDRGVADPGRGSGAFFDPGYGSGINFFQVTDLRSRILGRTHELSNNFLVKKYVNLFLCLFKIEIKIQFVIIYGCNKVKYNQFFSPSPFLLLDPGW